MVHLQLAFQGSISLLMGGGGGGGGVPYAGVWGSGTRLAQVTTHLPWLREPRGGGKGV